MMVTGYYYLHCFFIIILTTTTTSAYNRVCCCRMPTKTTGFKSKIFVILKKEEELNGYTYLYIFHHMHCNNLPCEGSIFLHFFLRHLFCPSSYEYISVLHGRREHVIIIIKITICIFPLLYLFFFVFLFFFFCPHQQNTNIRRTFAPHRMYVC